ncbi:MAG: hypothetical protein H3C34_10105 [Caldilineaceae bacterium]|nr:hypothetical protein [Caldilineaceae bacterium]
MALWLDRLVKPSPTNEPPTSRDIFRNDLYVALTVLFALILALGIRNQVYTASRSVTLEPAQLRLKYPERWQPRAREHVLFRATNPGSPSTFDALLEVSARPLRADETLERARFESGLQRASVLEDYRELEAESMLVLDGVPALVSTYAYIADPTRDSGANGLPVVVQAQDIMFVLQNQYYVVTLAADAVEWENELRDFSVIKESLNLRPPAALPDLQSGDVSAGTGATTAAPGANGDDTFSGESQQEGDQQ